MNRKYLNDHAKSYYANALEEEIRNGKIDDEIITQLRAINSNNYIRTIFSKKGKDLFGRSLHSYLNIAFTEAVENILLSKVAPYFEQNYRGKNRSQFRCLRIPPRINEGRNTTAENKGAKWLTDPEYFNIDQLSFDLKKGSTSLHDQFWDDLKEQLSII